MVKWAAYRSETHIKGFDLDGKSLKYYRCCETAAGKRAAGTALNP